jgi:host factor-I protein
VAAGGVHPSRPLRAQRLFDSHMAAERPKTLQETFLDHVREQQTPLTIFLMNGVKLQGVVASFDSFSITLVRDGWSQLIYKHAVSTIMPAEPIKLEYE